MNFKVKMSANRIGTTHLNQKGVTLIELLIVLVICAMVVAGIYRLFVSQSRAYVVQEQVVEVQQSLRIAMDTLVTDLWLTGYDSDALSSKINVATPIVVGQDSMTVSYEYDDTTLYTVAYWRDGANSTLVRQLTTTKDDGSSTIGASEILLENVEALNFSYGVDEDDNGVMDTKNGNGIIEDADWISAGGVGSLKVAGVRVLLRAGPTEVNPDLKVVSARTLTSAVMLRNLLMKK